MCWGHWRCWRDPAEGRSATKAAGVQGKKVVFCVFTIPGRRSPGRSFSNFIPQALQSRKGLLGQGLAGPHPQILQGLRICTWTVAWGPSICMSDTLQRRQMLLVGAPTGDPLVLGKAALF